MGEICYPLYVKFLYTFPRGTRPFPIKRCPHLLKSCLLVEDPLFKSEAIRYIRRLKRDSHSVESHLLLEKLSHETPAELPAYMWDESFKLWERFCTAQPYSDFKERLYMGECALEDTFSYLYFILESPNIGDLYAKMNYSSYFVNATIFLDNVEDCPVVFPAENMPSLKGLAISSASYYSFGGTLPPTLEVLAIDNGIYPDQIDDIDKSLPSLEAFICRGTTNDCICQERVCSLLPNMLGMLPAKNSFLGYTTWVGHVYYRDMNILSEICEVSLPERYQNRLNFLQAEEQMAFKAENNSYFNEYP
uniref:RES domain-containing protein n=1 Tax=Strongyloides papillosus TaxID=174720 RepID=A0A0N5BHM7_STREA